jgi:hypothetical protein
MKAEKQLVALLSMPLGTRDAVTVLSLDQYPPLMTLLSRRTHKDMALKVVQTVLAQVRVRRALLGGRGFVCGEPNRAFVVVLSCAAATLCQAGFTAAIV